jgi:hypothetical protein
MRVSAQPRSNKFLRSNLLRRAASTAEELFYFTFERASTVRIISKMFHVEQLFHVKHFGRANCESVLRCATTSPTFTLPVATFELRYTIRALTTGTIHTA